MRGLNVVHLARQLINERCDELGVNHKRLGKLALAALNEACALYLDEVFALCERSVISRKSVTLMYKDMALVTRPYRERDPEGRPSTEREVAHEVGQVVAMSRNIITELGSHCRLSSSTRVVLHTLAYEYLEVYNNILLTCTSTAGRVEAIHCDLELAYSLCRRYLIEKLASSKFAYNTTRYVV